MTIPDDLRIQVYERDDYQCRYCGSRRQPLQVDHVYPESKGGQTTLENLVTACYYCNHAKGATVGTWPKPLGYYSNPFRRLLVFWYQMFTAPDYRTRRDRPGYQSSPPPAPEEQQIIRVVIPEPEHPKPVGDEWFWMTVEATPDGKGTRIGQGGRIVEMEEAGIDSEQFFTSEGEVNVEQAKEVYEIYLQALAKATEGV